MDEGKRIRLSPTITYHRRKKPEKETRNWLELPSDIMVVILSKLDFVDILFHAQLVCSSWKKVTKDRRTFRSIRVPNSVTDGVWSRLLDVAVKRSKGQLTEISVENGAACDDKLLSGIAWRPNLLKSLRIASFRSKITFESLVDACKNLPLLEELEFTDISWDDNWYGRADRVFITYHKNIAQVGKSCSQLKYLRIFGKYTHPMCQRSPYNNRLQNEMMLSIAENMPNLRGLRLYLTTLTNQGLQTLVAGCPHLETLDLQECGYLGDIKDSVLEMCRLRIKDLTLPSGLVTPLNVRIQLATFA